MRPAQGSENLDVVFGFGSVGLVTAADSDTGAALDFGPESNCFEDVIALGETEEEGEYGDRAAVMMKALESPQLGAT